MSALRGGARRALSLAVVLLCSAAVAHAQGTPPAGAKPKGAAATKAAPGPAKPAMPAPPPLPPVALEPFLGPWTATLTVEASTCAGTTVGQVSKVRWMIAPQKARPGSVQLVESEGRKGDPKTLSGTTRGNVLELRQAGTVGLDLASGPSDAAGPHLVGRRLSVRGGTCAVVQQVTTQRPDDVAWDAGATDPDAGFTLEAAVAGLPAEKIILATLDTDVGQIVCELAPDQAPLAVANFVGLARGRRAWKDPKTGRFVRGRPFYDGLAFHRVIPGFVIQGGDPRSRDWDVGQLGAGDAGYRIPDDPPGALRFDRPGRLAVANAGPGTGGSQFFITEAPLPHLERTAVIFGRCGPLPVLQRAARVPADAQTGRPDLPLVIKKVTITRVPDPVLE